MIFAGILLNDEMDDFSFPDINNGFGLPPSPHNFVRPGKRPLSSMCPSVLMDTQSRNVSLVVGAAGGTKITTSVALTSLYNLYHGWSLNDSVGRRSVVRLLPVNMLTYQRLPGCITNWSP